MMIVATVSRQLHLGELWWMLEYHSQLEPLVPGTRLPSDALQEARAALYDAGASAEITIRERTEA